MDLLTVVGMTEERDRELLAKMMETEYDIEEKERRRKKLAGIHKRWEEEAKKKRKESDKELKEYIKQEKKKGTYLPPTFWPNVDNTSNKWCDLCGYKTNLSMRIRYPANASGKLRWEKELDRIGEYDYEKLSEWKLKGAENEYDKDKHIRICAQCIKAFAIR